MTRIGTCLDFPRTTEGAFDFHRSVFSGDCCALGACAG
jgi:hypothetical protein